MSVEVVRIESPNNDSSAEVAVGLGFNCFSWKTQFAGEAATKPREMLWSEPGFSSGDLRPSSSGIPLLLPFPGRIAGAALTWEGRSYELEPTGGNGNAIHGFAMRAPWRVTEQTPSSVTASFQPSLDDPAVLPQWPSDYRAVARYAIEASRLIFDLTVINVGETSMPFGFATHAYFQLPLADGADPEATTVQVDVDGEWLMTDLIPTGQIKELTADNPVSAGKPLAGREFDTPYRLAPGARQTVLTDPASGRALRQSFEEGMTCCVIYTPGHREAICLEPYSCLPDPVALDARGVPAGLVTLAPGESYKTTTVLAAETVA